MQQLTLNITYSKFQTFLEFIKTLDYVEVPDVDEKALEGLQNSLNQVKMMQEGKMKNKQQRISLMKYSVYPTPDFKKLFKKLS